MRIHREAWARDAEASSGAAGQAENLAVELTRSVEVGGKHPHVCDSGDLRAERDGLRVCRVASKEVERKKEKADPFRQSRNLRSLSAQRRGGPGGTGGWGAFPGRRWGGGMGGGGEDG